MTRQDKLARKFLVRTSCALVAVFAVLAWAMSAAPPTSANHPVLLEGNCDSPVPGTTLVEAGTCGDYDGDTRIGTAEDTDGADRIFGTLKAAIGPGAGAAAGTGANGNGRVVIVASGRYSEAVDPPPSAPRAKPIWRSRFTFAALLPGSGVNAWRWFGAVARPLGRAH